MSAQVDVLGAIDGLRDLARHRLTMKRREFDKMIAAGKEPNWLASVKADRAEYLVQQGDAARAAVAALIAERDALRMVLKEVSDCSEYWSEYFVPVGLPDRIRAALATGESA